MNLSDTLLGFRNWGFRRSSLRSRGLHFVLFLFCLFGALFFARGRPVNLIWLTGVLLVFIILSVPPLAVPLVDRAPLLGYLRLVFARMMPLFRSFLLSRLLPDAQGRGRGFRLRGF